MDNVIKTNAFRYARRLAQSQRLARLAQEVSSTDDALKRQVLIAELRDLCNLVGRPMPDLALLGQDYRQLPLGV